MLHLLLIGLTTISFPGISSAFAPTPPFAVQRLAGTKTELMAATDEMDRRTFFANAATGISAVVLCAPASASALNRIPADNEIIKEQRTVVDKLDINNAPVADYMQMPGMYPTVGGKIANGGPYNSLKDVYKLKGLTSAEVSKIKEYESELTVTAATGLDTMRGRDPYRRSFNK